LANRSRATFQKREKEKARQQKLHDKQNRRAEAKLNTTTIDRNGDEDPDIAGIRPGPQPLPEEWSDLGEIEETE